jgi:uncharacterized phage-associated protein
MCRELKAVAMDRASPIEIAKWFINRADRQSGDDMTHLKLQKLIHFAQAWRLSNTGEPLFDEDMEASPHGPVVPSVWHAYEQHQWGSIPIGQEPQLDHRVAEYLEWIYKNYGQHDGNVLEFLSQRLLHKDPIRLSGYTKR